MNKRIISIPLLGILSVLTAVQNVSASQINYYSSKWVNIPSKTSKTLSHSCPNNQKVISGGFETRMVPQNTAEGFTVTRNTFANKNKWEIRLRNQDDINRTVKMHIICIE